MGVVCEMKENELLEPDGHFFLFLMYRSSIHSFMSLKNLFIIYLAVTSLVAMCWLLSVVLGLGSYPLTRGILVS